ncbi:hypothetical protein [Marinirhabdus gelatinilytica]|uniref:Uncharacterized protein n=1 Tax=Marinirhabdus gelatinilytica TaxID=1703343 RepID=A0A370QB64_9FLAO|nr:hypothetical protein [Marinirhabdus gelatinilytica]RDK85602.1 hypothetical protein C8D94_103429 [Marinirhabdus gelatinilytica]
MRKILFLSAILCIITSVQVHSQGFECPPGAWCHPDGSGLGGGPWEYGFMAGMTEAADAVGKASQGDPCGEKSYAEQVYCYPAQWLAGVIACGYGEDTPQHTMCDEDDSGDTSTESLTNKEREILKKVKNKAVHLNPNFRPVYITAKNSKKALKDYLAKTKRGQTIKKWKQGYTLTLAYKYYTSEDKKDYTAVFHLKNKKGNVIANPTLFTKKNKVYIADILHKK